MLVPFVLGAQTDDFNKYMSGAVPEVDGKVVFNRYLNVSEFSQGQIYNALAEWAAKKYVGAKARMILADPESSTIVVQGYDEIVVRIGIFPGKVNMISIVKFVCGSGSCVMEVSKVRYTNNPASKKPTDIITAEEYITDKHALNKTKTKIHKGLGDYRIRTIDVIDETALEAQNFIHNFYEELAKPSKQIAAPSSVRHSAAAPQPVKAAPDVSLAAGVPASVPQISVEPELVAHLNSGKFVMYVTKVDDWTLDKPVAGKGGFDLNGARPAVSFSVETNTDNILFLLSRCSNYTLAVFDASTGLDKAPELVVECRKIQNFDKLFIGEILKVDKK